MIRGVDRLALLALVLPWLGGCLSDLSVGLSALEADDAALSASDAAASDGGQRDASVRDAATRDTGALDAQAGPDAASCTSSRCPDADASSRDGSAPPDADTRDAASGDAHTRDASRADAGDPCVPSDCEYAGLVVTLQSCPAGVELECRLNHRGVCDLLCGNDPLIRTDVSDAATRESGEATTRLSDDDAASARAAAASDGGEPNDAELPSRDD